MLFFCDECFDYLHVVGWGEKRIFERFFRGTRFLRSRLALAGTPLATARYTAMLPHVLRHFQVGPFGERSCTVLSQPLLP